MKNLLAFVVLALASALHTANASSDRLGPTAQHPALSPSSTEIAFTADFDGQARIWTVALDGSHLRRLSSVFQTSSGSDSEPSWSPDGRRLAYASANSNASEIWVMNADGTNAQQLTSLGANSTSPAWSPDGTRVLFISDKEGTKAIWSINVGNSQITRLIASSGEENNVKFSPAGDQIVFSQTTGEVASLMIANANGTGVRVLTSGNFRDWEPNWSKRGIVFTSNREAPDEWKIWVVQPDGSGLHKLADVRGHDPAWLPDGRVIVTDESLGTRATAGLSLIDPSSGTKQPVVDVQGFLVPIDIRPGKDPNPINPRSSGRAAVAILSTRSFDATKRVVQPSLTFGRTGSEASFAYCAKPYKDVNGDGLPDLVCRFSLRGAGFQMGNTLGILRFLDDRGVPWEGRDLITTVTEDDPSDLKD